MQESSEEITSTRLASTVLLKDDTPLGRGRAAIVVALFGISASASCSRGR